ncbi:zinc-binding dehydrogenase [candidate division KSB1 bacterium]|nr:zinc-binding dehydrogenase [candidate division KSB1 bacterium]
MTTRERMKALVVHRPGEYEVAKVPIPHPEQGQVLIDLKAACLCNQHDLKVWTGGYRQLSYLEYGVPGFPGHEGAGEIVAVGADVSGFAVGDRVVFSGLGGPPLYQEFVLRNTAEIVRFSDNLPFEQVAMAELFGCVHRGLMKRADWRGKSVLVAGLGPAGLAAVQMARALGASEIWGSDLRNDRLALAAQLGADQTIDASRPEALTALQKHGFDCVYETTGNSASVRNSLTCAREILILFGYSEGELVLDAYPIFDRELSIVGSKWLTVHDLQTVVAWMESGDVRTAAMISHRFSFAEYPRAIDAIRRGQVVKAVLTPGG